MGSHKVVFFLPPDVEGCHLLKELFQDKFGMLSGNDENLVFDYISHKYDVTSVELKLYLVPDIEKFEKIRPLYFTNVHTFVVVFDVTKWSLPAWEKIVKDLKLSESNSKMVFLGYQVNDANMHAETFDFISNCNGAYFGFSERTGLESVIEALFEKLDLFKPEIIRTS